MNCCLRISVQTRKKSVCVDGQGLEHVRCLYVCSYLPGYCVLWEGHSWGAGMKAGCLPTFPWLLMSFTGQSHLERRGDGFLLESGDCTQGGGVMLQSILLGCKGWEGTWGFPKRNRKWTCGEASGAMERKRFLLECYRGTAWVVLQPKKPLRESLQQALSLQRHCEKRRHLFLNNLLDSKHPLVFVPSGTHSV